MRRVQAMLQKVDDRHVYHVPDYFHVTLKLIGWLNDELKSSLPRILEIFQGQLRDFRMPPMLLHGVSYFPSVIYVKVHDNSGVLRSTNMLLVKKLGGLVKEFAFEGDTFMPHVTIATFKTRDVGNLLAQAGSMANTRIGTVNFSEARIVEFRAHLAYGTLEQQTGALLPLGTVKFQPHLSRGGSDSS